MWAKLSVRTRLFRGMAHALRRLCSEASEGAPQRTCLYDVHARYNAKMVPFAGFSMPVQYAEQPIGASVQHARKCVAIFDVSHMLQTRVHGTHRVAFMESLVPADVEGLGVDRGTLTLFTNEAGGINDDLIVTKTTKDHLYLVTNAACANSDLAHLQAHEAEWKGRGMDVSVEPLFGRGLIAIQGPETVNLLQSGMSTDLTKLFFMHSVVDTVYGVPDCRITRCGYTGEDGVEISVDADAAPTLVETLLKVSKAQPKLAGLGARDVLRLEAGLCLYGNDIDATTSPAEAALAWLIPKRRRETLGFPGARKIVDEIVAKTAARKRVGLMAPHADSMRPARAGCVLLNDEEKEVGVVTSGCPSPILRRNIAMAYVKSQHSKIGTELHAVIGSKSYPFTVTKMPFVPSHYYTPPKPL